MAIIWIWLTAQSSFGLSYILVPKALASLRHASKSSILLCSHDRRWKYYVLRFVSLKSVVNAYMDIKVNIRPIPSLANLQVAILPALDLVA
jgi:hypothetical protein